MVKAYKLPSGVYVDGLIAPPLPTPTPFVSGPDIKFIGKSNRQGGIVVPPPAGKKGFNTTIGCGWETLQNSVFLAPKLVDLGVSADATVRTFDMWHTHAVQLLVNNIVQSGTRGMTLTRTGGNTKDTIPALGRVEYVLNIGLQTETVIDASYTWQTTPSVVGVSIKITGSRVVPWPYIPQGERVETREWLTDVIRTRKREQRLSLRRGPRKTIAVKYQLQDNELSNMWSHAHVWVNQSYAVPDWNNFLRVGDIAKGTRELSFNAINLGLVASGFAFIYQNNTKFEVRPIKAVSTSKVEFVDPVTEDYSNATITPMFLSTHEHPLGIQRTAYGVSLVDTTWEILDDTLNASNPFPLYSGSPVVTDEIVMGGTSSSEQFGFDIDRIDNKVGLYTDFQGHDWDSRTRAQLRWSCDTQSEFERVRNFLDFCRGKQGEFWVPTWNADFVLKENISTTLGGIVVLPTDVATFFKEFHIMIELVDGTRHFTKVTSATKGTESDTLMIAPLVGGISRESVSRICRINRMRFDTDRFEFNRKHTGVIDISAPIVSVPEGQ